MAIDELHVEVTSGFANVRAEMKAEFASLRHEIKTDGEKTRHHMDLWLAKFQAEVLIALKCPAKPRRG